MARLCSGQGVAGVYGGGEVLELVVPIPVDAGGDVKGLADLRVAVPGDQVSVVMPGGENFRAGFNRDLAGASGGAVSDPE